MNIGIFVFLNGDLDGCVSKPMGSIFFGVGEFTTHFSRDFSGWIGMFRFGVRAFDPWPDGEPRKVGCALVKRHPTNTRGNLSNPAIVEGVSHSHVKAWCLFCPCQCYSLPWSGLGF